MASQEAEPTSPDGGPAHRRQRGHPSPTPIGVSQSTLLLGGAWSPAPRSPRSDLRHGKPGAAAPMAASTFRVRSCRYPPSVAGEQSEQLDSVGSRRREERALVLAGQRWNVLPCSPLLPRVPVCLGRAGGTRNGDTRAVSNASLTPRQAGHGRYDAHDQGVGPDLAGDDGD